MKLRSLPRPLQRQAFTLAEMMVVTAILSIVIGATVSAQVFGLRLYTISETKLTVTADARKALNRLRDEVRTGRLLYVGNGDHNSFKLIADGQAQAGNALRICSTTDTNDFVYYFADASDLTLNRMVSGSDAVQIIAHNITNQMVFRAEDFQGNVVTNNQNNRVIRMQMQFHQREWALAGNNGMYDYYQLQTRIARRARE